MLDGVEVTIARGTAATDVAFFDFANGLAADATGQIAVVTQHPLTAAAEDAVVTPHGIGHRPAFANGQRFGLFAKDVLLIAAGVDGDDGVPVVGRADLVYLIPARQQSATWLERFWRKREVYLIPARQQSATNN